MYSAKWDAEYVSFKGAGNVTVQDAEILRAIDEASWEFWRGLFLTQGGLSTSVAASANTHAGLGAFDIRTRNNTRAELWKLAAMFLRSGIVLFPRGYNVGRDFFRNNKHGHAVSRESYDSLHPSAKAQYKEYIAGGDGLVGSAQYTGPSTKFERWKTSPYNPSNITADTALYTVDVSSGFLWGLTVDRKKKVARDKGETVQAAKQVKRWGRQNCVTADDTYYALDYLEVAT
jgi:hypothetical protein